MTVLSREMVNREWRIDNNYKPCFALTKLILQSHKKNAHMSAIVFGPKRVGKSVYSLKVGEDLFQAFGLDEKEAWRFSIGSVVYTLEEFLQSLEVLTEIDIPYPYLIVDDAGVGFSHLMRFTPEAQALKKVFDTIGTLVTAIIYTTPNPKGLLNYVRNVDSLRIKIVERSNARRMAWSVGAEMTETGDLVFSSEGAPVDEFYVKLDDWKYEEYNKLRRSYSRRSVKEAIEVVLGGKENEEKNDKVPCSLCGKELNQYEAKEVVLDGQTSHLCEACYVQYTTGKIKNMT